MKRFHDGISSKTFKKDNTIKINPLNLLMFAVVGIALSINI